MKFPLARYEKLDRQYLGRYNDIVVFDEETKSNKESEKPKPGNVFDIQSIFSQREMQWCFFKWTL
jgi:hypothetical protein